jgi:hypothetical protein
MKLERKRLNKNENKADNQAYYSVQCQITVEMKSLPGYLLKGKFILHILFA